MSGNDNNYYDLAQNLRQSITNMKIKIDSQLRRLALLKDRVKDQVVEMQRLEVRRAQAHVYIHTPHNSNDGRQGPSEAEQPPPTHTVFDDTVIC